MASSKKPTTNAAPGSKAHQRVADIFSHLGEDKQQRLMADLAERDGAAAAQVQERMFTFKDLVRLEGADIQLLLRGINTADLLLALKGAPRNIVDLFFSNMSQRAERMLFEDMEARDANESMGPVTDDEVAKARAAIVVFAKVLIDSGRITLRDEGEIWLR